MHRREENSKKVDVNTGEEGGAKQTRKKGR